MYSMVKYGVFDETEEDMLRKCVVFYSAVGAEKPPEKFELDHIERVSEQQIKRDLKPVLRKGEKYDLEVMQKKVRNFKTYPVILWHYGNAGINRLFTTERSGRNRF